MLAKLVDMKPITKVTLISSILAPHSNPKYQKNRQQKAVNLRYSLQLNDFFFLNSVTFGRIFPSLERPVEHREDDAQQHLISSILAPLSKQKYEKNRLVKAIHLLKSDFIPDMTRVISIPIWLDHFLFLMSFRT
jgi:hypothetical protein